MAVTFIFPLDVTGAPTVKAGGIVKPTFVTVPTEKLLLADKSLVTPLIVSVRVVGTGVYPNAVIISPGPIVAAEVINPLPFTATFKNELLPYTLGFTVSNVSVTGDPVVPEPVTSPTNDNEAEGIAIVTRETLVTNPFAFTVILATCVEEPYVAGAGLTVANVSTAEPGPVAVPSPVKADI